MGSSSSNGFDLKRQLSYGQFPSVPARDAEVKFLFEPYLEVQRDEGEHKCFEILHQVIEHAKTLRVSRFSHIDQRADFRGLRGRKESSASGCSHTSVFFWGNVLDPTSKEMCSLPSRISSSWRPSLFFCGHFESSSLGLSVSVEFLKGDKADFILQDFTLLDNAFDFLDHGGAHTHCSPVRSHATRTARGVSHSLSLRMRESLR